MCHIFVGIVIYTKYDPQSLTAYNLVRKRRNINVKNVQGLLC